MLYLRTSSDGIPEEIGKAMLRRTVELWEVENMMIGRPTDDSQRGCLSMETSGENFGMMSEHQKPLFNPNLEGEKVIFSFTWCSPLSHPLCYC